MNVFNIIVKEIKHNLRSFKSMAMMVLFPIVVIVVFGLVFSGFYGNKSPKLENINVLYTINSTGSNTPVFKSFMDAGTKNGLNFIETKDVQAGIRDMKNSRYACFIEVSEENGKINLYKNERVNFDAAIVETMLSTFVQTSNVISEIQNVNPELLSGITKEGPPRYVKPVSLDKKRQPGAMDFYAVTMITMVIIYSAIGALWAINSERVQKTSARLLCSPVKKHEILTGKTIGIFIITLFQIIIVFLFSKYVLHTYWGSNVGAVLLVLMSEIFMAVAMGIGISFIVRDVNTANGILNIVPLFAVFLGGGYIPLEIFNSSLLLKIGSVSPVKWTNDAIFRTIYSNDAGLVPTAVIINIAIAAVFIAAASFISGKEALLQ